MVSLCGVTLCGVTLRGGTLRGGTLHGGTLCGGTLKSSGTLCGVCLSTADKGLWLKHPIHLIVSCYIISYRHTHLCGVTCAV